MSDVPVVRLPSSHKSGVSKPSMSAERATTWSELQQKTDVELIALAKGASDSEYELIVDVFLTRRGADLRNLVVRQVWSGTPRASREEIIDNVLSDLFIKIGTKGLLRKAKHPRAWRGLIARAIANLAIDRFRADGGGRGPKPKEKIVLVPMDSAVVVEAVAQDLSSVRPQPEQTATSFNHDWLAILSASVRMAREHGDVYARDPDSWKALRMRIDGGYTFEEIASRLHREVKWTERAIKACQSSVLKEARKQGYDWQPQAPRTRKPRTRATK